jgi:hypothetical protein
MLSAGKSTGERLKFEEPPGEGTAVPQDCETSRQFGLEPRYLAQRMATTMVDTDKVQAEWLLTPEFRESVRGALSIHPRDCQFHLPSMLHSAPVTPSPVSTGVSVPRRRFQRGSLVEKSGRWYGVYRSDVLKADGTFKREQC